MIAFVAHEAEATRRTPDGVRQIDHWRAAARQGNASMVDRLDGPPFPTEIGYLYDWFGELNAGRSVTMAGPAPITFEAIDAWARLCATDVAPHEVRALMAIDQAWLGSVTDAKEATDTPTAEQTAAPKRSWPAPKASPQDLPSEGA